MKSLRQAALLGLLIVSTLTVTATRADEGLWLRSSDGKASFKPSVYLIFRYQDLTEKDQPDEEGFKFRAARLGAGGHIYNENVTYRAEIDFATPKNSRVNDAVTDQEKWNLTPKDVFINYKVNDSFSVRAGQFKVPFSVQEVTSDKKLQFPDRSIANDNFKQGRDHGLMFHGKVDRFGYALGVFNGEGENSQNKDAKYLYAGTISYAPIGEFADDETSLNVKDWAVKVALEHLIKNSNPKAMNKSGLYLGVKKSRFSFAGEYFLGQDENNIKSTGFYVQEGYFLLPDLELSIRASKYDIDVDTDDDELTELGGALNYYISSHNLKAQLAYSITEPENSAGEKFSSLVAQLLVYF